MWLFDLLRIATECGLVELEIAFTNSGRIPGTALHWPLPFGGQMFSDNIGLAPTTPAPPICVKEGGSGAVATAVGGYTTPAAAVGFLGADVYDANRTTLGALAFAAVGQTKAFYADSTPSAVDRQNVRDGHYTMWGYEHMFAYVDSSGQVKERK